MKSCILAILALIALVAADEEWKPLPDEAAHVKVHEDCLKTSGLTKKQIEELGRFVFPDEKEVREHILCFVKTVGFFTDEGGYITARLLAQLVAVKSDTEKGRAKIASCVAKSNEHDDSPAVRAYSGAKCLLSDKERTQTDDQSVNKD